MTTKPRQGEPMTMQSSRNRRYRNIALVLLAVAVLAAGAIVAFTGR